MPDLNDRGTFLNLAGVFEGGLALLALAAGWALGVDPLRHLRWEWPALLWGVAGAVPLIVLLGLAYRFGRGRLRQLTELWTELLGPPLAACRWYDLVLLAVLAGFAEELLFRGLLQVWLFEHWGLTVALVGSNLLFALAHSVTPLYALLAGLVGVYLGVLFRVGGEHQLLAPIVTHAVYDYVAFLILLRVFRTKQPSFDGEEPAE